MKNTLKLAAASALALMIAAPAFAQATITGVTALDDRIDDITDDAQTDLNRGNDAARFGPLGVVQGFRGSFALTGSAATGNTEANELSVAGRMNYGIGDWNHSFGVAAEFGEAAGVTNERKFFATYEGSRYFTPNFYAFGIGRYQYDGFATNTHDAFLGFGPGYRVVNTEKMAWRIQAGPGVRYVDPLRTANTTEVGFLASSRFFYGLTDTISLTNDTDILGSETDTIVSNDFGVNFKVSDNLSTRFSYRTDYNTDPAPGKTATDNTLGVSLIVGF